MLLPFTQAKQVLDRLKRLCLGRDMPDASACARFDKATRQNGDMRAALRLLAVAFVETEKNYRRVTGYEHLWMLKAHLDRVGRNGGVAPPFVFTSRTIWAPW